MQFSFFDNILILGTIFNNNNNLIVSCFQTKQILVIFHTLLYEYSLELEEGNE